jgi:hypothetical protein
MPAGAQWFNCKECGDLAAVGQKAVFQASILVAGKLPLR